MKLKIQFFGPVADAVGCARAEVETPNGASVAQAVEVVKERFPKLRSALNSTVRFAVNTSYADEKARLNENDTLSFIPPVGGG